MPEKIRSIKFHQFRGLPSNEVKLKGKSLALLGANGKGKSALVDGIEFLFTGRVARFSGTGTGSINHDQAVKHIKSTETPKVELSLSPSNGNLSRELGHETTNSTGQEALSEFASNHTNVDAFVLRRARILEFVNDQDADRYRKFVRLLGIAMIDDLQRSFNEAAGKSNSNLESKKRELTIGLAKFKDAESDFDPTSLSQVFDKICDTIETFELARPSSCDDFPNALELLKKKRPETNKGKIEALTRALVSLESALPTDVSNDIVLANELRAKLSDLETQSDEAAKSTIIANGISYITETPDDTSCPLCERLYEIPTTYVLKRLNERKESQRDLYDARQKRQTAVGRIINFAENLAEQLKRDLEHSEVIVKPTLTRIRDARAKTLRWWRFISRVERRKDNTDFESSIDLNGLVEIRSELTQAIRSTKESLTPPDTSNLEKAILELEHLIASHADIKAIAEAIKPLELTAKRAEKVKQAFSKAREAAIQQVFNKIAGKVLEYYNRLHDLGPAGDKSECTKLDLVTTARAASGGLKLVIEFLNLEGANDPRGFLSEGHLDSLGLCIYLATVRIFNPAGTLLVLDDVLTSIDKEHRRRVAELLVEEFSEYQLVLTTHDEHWFELLRSTVRAYAKQGSWTFQMFESWSVDTGPAVSETQDSWDHIDRNLNESSYRELGGSFRLVLEDFMKRTCANLKLKVRYRYDGKYTSGDFYTAGLHDELAKQLIAKDSANEDNIRREIARVFGQGDFINFLSHDNPGRLEVTFDQACDFVEGIRDLTARCREHRLIRGE